MNMSDNTTFSQEASSVTQTPGQMLRAIREEKNISLGEVVQKLLLTKHIIMALEADDYNKISAQVYAEGYLKAYAQFLQIPVANILASFYRINPYGNKTIPTDSENIPSFYLQALTVIKKLPTSVLLGGGGAIILILFLFFIGRIFFGGTSSNNPSPEKETHLIANLEDQL